MRRYTSLWLAAALLLAAAPASAEGTAKGVVETPAERDHFSLWQGCKPTRLSVHLSEKETYIDLTKDAIEIAVRSRLRAARLYSGDIMDPAPWLYVTVAVVGDAFHVRFEFMKFLIEPIKKMLGLAVTWSTDATGTHSGDSNFILSSVEQITDLFIDEYLRVNAGVNCE